MKCAFTSGILDCLIKDGVRADYVIGVSAGASCGASYVLAHKGENIRGFLETAGSKSAMGIHSFFRSGSFFDLGGIYESGVDAGYYQMLLDNHADITVVATEARTGRPHYFTKADFAPDNCLVYEASSAIPILCRPVMIGGTGYYDGGCSDPLPVRKALKDGCDRLIVALCRPENFVMKPQKYRFVYSRVLRSYPGLVCSLDCRHMVYNESLDLVRRLAAGKRAFIFSPQENTSSMTYTKNQDKLKHLYCSAVRVYRSRRADFHAFWGYS